MAHKNTRTPSGFLPPASGQLPSLLSGEVKAVAPTSTGYSLSLNCGAGAFYDREEISHPYSFPPNGEPRNAADEIANAMWEAIK